MKVKKRGLSEAFMKAMIEGELHGFLDAVHCDATLCMEIRENYVNIYYRGGNLCKITEKSKNGGYGFEFDSKYASSEDDKALAKKLKSSGIEVWLENMPNIKAIMDKWFSANPKEEREFQQQIARENNRTGVTKDTDYYIIDLEYTSAKSKGRFDMVAVKWLSTSHNRKKSTNLQLAVIEVKYGDGAMTGEAGIANHFSDWMDFFENKDNLAEFKDEMRQVFNQKVKLGLIRGVEKEIESFSEDNPELIFLLANHKPVSEKWHNELNEIMKNNKAALQNSSVLIAKSSMMGYGLYSSCMVPVTEYIERHL